MNSADAVMDVVAPPTRTAPTRAPSAANADEPSFEDHLDAASHEDAHTESAPASAAAEATSTEELLGGPESAPVVAQTPQTEPTASPVFVQLIAPVTPQAPQSNTQAGASVGETAPITPQAPAPTNDTAAPVQSAPKLGASPGTAPVDGASEQGAASSQQKSAGQEQSAAQQAPAQQATAVAPQQATATATPAVAANAGAAAATLAVEGVTTTPTPTSSAQTQAMPDATRHGKATSAQKVAKAEAAAAPEQQPAPAAANVASRVNAKANAPQATANDSIAVQALDAPEAAQPQAQSTSTAPTATPAQHVETDQAAARALPAANQVAREIVRRFDGGNTRFELRLDPPELGRVDVRLEVSRDHRVTAVIAADSPQALTELARHARELEQMLQGAGLELGDNGLSFDLRQHTANEATEFGETSFSDATPNEETTAIAARPLGYERWRGVRVDMMV